MSSSQLSGTVTFLFTDIEGSTRLWQRDETAMRAALSRHDALLRETISNEAGTVFSTMGDGMAAAFGSASAAIRAALAAQELLAAESWPTATPLRVRMGIHTGEAERRGGDYFGTAVNRAARLMGIGHGGQVLCSQAAAALLGDDVALDDLGEHRLRDLDRPMRVFQVGGGSFPPLRSLDSLPGNLPSLASSFVGREADLAAVAKDLGAWRLVTLTGVGGVGKTRLALQVAAELLPGLADGAWVCELAAASTGDDLVQVVATALGVVQRQQMTLAESIVDFLRGRRTLVLLDNCEHLLDDAAALAGAVLAEAPGVRILATSREGLGIPGEHVRPLRSLSLGEASEAVELFAERARAVDPGFVLDATSAASVVELCRRLDGIPLAIELAAARVNAMSPAEMAGHLDERFRLLTGGRRGRVERHQTLRAAVEWSHSLLSDTERTVFGRLGVFPASFDETAAVAVCTGGGIERWDVIDALAGLVAKSMVGAERTGDVTRYQLLETLRHYARDRAGRGDDMDGLRRRHAAHYADFAAQARTGLVSRHELLWTRRVAGELDNLRAATGWSFDAADPDDVRLGARMLDALIWLIWARPSWGIDGWALAGLARMDSLRPPDRSAVYTAAAHVAYALGQFDRAIELARPVIASPDWHSYTFASATNVVALSRIAAGDPSGVMALYDGDAWGSNFPQFRHVGRSAMAYLVGDLETARAEAERGLAAARDVGAPTAIASALMCQARAFADTDPEKALAAAEEAMGYLDGGAGDTIAATILLQSALLRWARGDAAQAARLTRTAVEHACRVLGSRPIAASLVALAAFLVAEAGDTATATSLSGSVAGPVLGSIPLVFLGTQRPRYDDTVARLAADLGPEAFTAAQQRGAAMTYEEIIDFTLEQLARLARPEAPGS